MRVPVIALVGLILLAALPLAPAVAQDVGAAVADLRDHDVTFEDGALNDRDVAELDALASDLDDGGTDFKIVVLGEPVGAKFGSMRAFAQQVLDGLGGSGRVLAYDPNEVGIASSVDSADELTRAEDAAVAAANRSNSFAEGTKAAAVELGAATGAATAGSTSGSDGGSWLPWLIAAVVVLAIVGVVAWLLLRRSSRRAAAARRAELAPAEGRVRDLVDGAARRVLDLADRATVPGVPPDASRLYTEGCDRFLDLQDDLEAADTRPELEAVYPRIVDAAWRLEAAEALLDGRPAPTEPTPAPLFPAAPAPAVPTTEHAGYRGFDVSPWLTQAAMAAVTMLAERRGRAEPSTRGPMAGDVFGDIFDGLGPGGHGSDGQSGRGSGRPRIAMGGRTGSARGRGMGRRK